jgi:transposase
MQLRRGSVCAGTAVLTPFDKKPDIPAHVDPLGHVLFWFDLLEITNQTRMAGKAIRMSIIKQMIRMRSEGFYNKAIARNLGISKNTVKKYFRKLDQSSLSESQLLQLEDHELESSLNIKTRLPGEDQRYSVLEGLLPVYRKELKRKGVTRWVLWEEYRQRYPQGYSYGQFCYHIQQYLKQDEATMHFEHEEGDKLYMDYTGYKLSWVDRTTGEIIPVEVYVAVLAFSQFTYVEAVPSQKKEDYISATCNTLEYFEGVPRVFVTDNLKSGVTKACKYEATVNHDFLEMANHYGASVLATRSMKPRDKALVERYVSIVYSRIFAPLRDRIFYSLEELNEAIWELLEDHNGKLFQGKKVTRYDLYEQEKEHLAPLPAERFEINNYRKVTVMKNCHIRLGDDKHYYSVPYRYIGKKVKVVFN